MRTIGIVSSQGGLGKTTVAVNLAAATAASGKRVVLLGLRRDTAWLLRGKRQDEGADFPRHARETVLPGLELLIHEPEYDARWVQRETSQCDAILRGLISNAADADVVFIDAAPGLSVMQSVVAVSEQVVLPMSPTKHGQAATVHLIELLRAYLSQDGRPGLPHIRGVVTQVHTRDSDVHEILSATQGVPVRWASNPLRYSSWYHNAGEQHRDRVFIPVLDSRRGSYPIADIGALADELDLLH